MTHCRLSDFLAHRLEGTPLPCACPECAARVRRWEADRAAAAGKAETLPDAFWTGQGARLREQAARPSPLRLWTLAGAAALLLLGTGLGLILTPSTPATDDYEARYAAIEAALERSALGDLEACAILLDDSNENGGTTAEEAL